MRKEQKEFIGNSILRYGHIGDYAKVDIESDLHHDVHPSKIMTRFINSCAAARHVGIKPLSNDPDYRQIVSALIEAGADPDVGTGKYPPIVAAAEKGELGTVEVLLESGADPNVNAEYPDRALHFAAYNGHVDIIRLLLNTGVDVNTRGGDRNTALHYAVENGQREAAEFLLLHGADPKAKNSARVSAYDMASVKKDNEMRSIFTPFV
jgi:hypothetical protein